jgi:hypothetical protein
MAYTDDADSDHEDNGIEMRATSRTVPMDDDDDDVDLEGFEDEGEVLVPVPLVQRQNRRFLRIVGTMVLFVSVVAIGMLYLHQPETVQGETENGVLSEEFSSDKEAEQHSSFTRDYSQKNWFSKHPAENNSAVKPKPKFEHGGAGGAGGYRHHNQFGPDAKKAMHDEKIHKIQNQANTPGGGGTLSPKKPLPGGGGSHLHRPGFGNGVGGGGGGGGSSGGGGGGSSNGGGGGGGSSTGSSGGVGFGVKSSTRQTACDMSAHADWLAAPVTLNDGVMYEVEGQFSHDRQAFV